MIGLGTTGGWRHADLTLAREFERRGIRVDGCWPLLSRVRRLRQLARPLSSEYVEAFAMRRALLRHVSGEHDIVVVSSNTGAMLLPRRWSRRTMVWSDTPIRLARSGRGARLLARAERRAMARVGLIAVQPQQSLALYRELFPEVADRVRFLPVPVSAPAHTSRTRERLGVTYAGNPEKKGLDLAVAAWDASGTDARLVVTGIAAIDARAFLAARSVKVPANVEFAGRIPADEHRRLTQRAAVFVSCSRREEYGNAQLEALADGAILVSGPCTGTAEPRAIARRLDPRFVCDGGTPEVGRCIALAIDLPDAERRAYQDAARLIMGEYSPEQFARCVDAVLTGP